MKLSLGLALVFVLSACPDESERVRYIEALERRTEVLQKQNAELEKINQAQADALMEHTLALNAIWNRLDSMDQALRISVYGSIYGKHSR